MCRIAITTYNVMYNCLRKSHAVTQYWSELHTCLNYLKAFILYTGFSQHWLGVVGSNHHSAITVSPTSAIHGVPNMPAQDARCTGNVWGVVGWLRCGVLYGMVRIAVSSTLQKEKESAGHKIAL